MAQTVSVRDPADGPPPATVARPGDAHPPRGPDVEPAAMAGMLAAQNNARQRIGLSPLAWSAELATKAEAAAKAEADGRCSSATARKAGDTEGVAVYWAARLSVLGGGASAQTILPSFVVSEWSAGRPDYDLSRHACRRSGACDQYTKMVSPTAKQVGCAKAICPSHAQVWFCRYDDSRPPSRSATSSAR